jgi:hypothetical protein
MSGVSVIPFVVSELRLPPDEQALLGREWWPSYAHAVVHADSVFLFDNGAGIGNAEIEATFSPRVRPIEDALGEHGISLADVTAAANCHLHFDHSGQNVRLKGIPIFVHRREWAMVPGPHLRGPRRRDRGRPGPAASPHPRPLARSPISDHRRARRQDRPGRPSAPVEGRVGGRDGPLGLGRSHRSSAGGVRRLGPTPAFPRSGARSLRP